MSNLIKFEPDCKLLNKYLIPTDKCSLDWYHNNLLKIHDFDNRFYDLLSTYKLLNHLSEVYCFAGLFANKIESLNTNYFFDKNKRIKGYKDQYYQLRKYIYSSTPDNIKLSFGGKQMKIFEGTSIEETIYFPPKEIEITNKILIQEILIAIDKIKEPSIKPSSDTARKDTFRADFLKSTKILYDFIAKSCTDTKPRHRHIFICELLELLGFDWNPIKSDRVNHLKRKYK